MLAIVVGLLLTVVVALGIVVLVALPNLRQGSRILTPDGQRAVSRAKQQARQKPLAAAGSTWHGLVALERLTARSGRQLVRFGRWSGRVWAPVSEALHAAMDRLETKDEHRPVDAGQLVGTAPETEQPQPPRVAAPEPEKPREAAVAQGPRQKQFDVSRITGGRSVGRPRTIPPISGPIPEITPQPASGAPGDRVIDVRDGATAVSARADSRTGGSADDSADGSAADRVGDRAADRAAGSARPAR